MACSSCRRVNCSSSSTCNNCSTQTTYLTTCSGCSETINTDCVIYNGDVLSFEPPTTTNGSTRTLTDLLALLENASCCDRESKFIKFHSDGETDDADAYTLVAEDTTKILMITQTDEGVVGTITNTITLPLTADFLNKEIIFKDISTPLDPSATTIVINFNQQIQYNWNPVQTSNVFSVLDSPNKCLRLRLIKVTELSYAWVIVD